MNPVEEGMLDKDEEKQRKSLEHSLWAHRHGAPGGRLLFTRDEVAKVLRTKPETIDKMVAKGRIPAVVLDEDEPPLFRPESVLSFLDELAPSKKRGSRHDHDEDDDDY